MAFSKYTGIGDGSNIRFSLNFTLGYLSEDDVQCQVGGEVDGFGDPVYRTLTFISVGEVDVGGTVPANGEEVVFTRTMNKATLQHDFSDGSPMSESNLDDNNKKAIMLVHEVLDGRFPDPLEADIDMGSNLVRNSGTPILDGDLTNKAYVDAVSGAASANAAAVSAAAALASETAAAASEAAAAASETAAAASEAALGDALLGSDNLSSVDDAATSFDNIKQSSTETYAGVVEKATNAEAISGTATDKFPDVVGVKAMIEALGAVDTTARDLGIANAIQIAILNDSAEDGLSGAYIWYATDDSWDVTTNADHSTASSTYSASHSSIGLDDVDKTGSANITSDEANPSTISNGTGNEAAYYDLGGTSITGDFDFNVTLPSANQALWLTIGFFDSTETGTFNAALNDGGFGSMTDAWRFQINTGGSGSGIYKGSTLSQAVTFSASDVLRITRVGSTITFYQGGVVKHTYTGEITGTVNVAFGHSNGGSAGAAALTGVDIWDDNNGASQNMTLANAVPATFKPSSDPDDVSVYVALSSEDSLTMGTNVIIGAKRLSGDSYVEGVLSDYTLVQVYADGRELWRVDLDLSGESAGNDPFAQIRTIGVDISVDSMVIRGDGGSWNGS